MSWGEGAQDAHCSAEQPKEDKKGEETEVSGNRQGQGEGHGRLDGVWGQA